MTQEHVDEQFSPALDGELAPRDLDAFEKHLAECERCSAAYVSFGQSVRALQRAPVAPLSGPQVEATVAAAFPEVEGGWDGSAPLPLAPRLAAVGDQERGSGRGRGSAWPLVLSHAAAVLLGCTLVFGGRLVLFDDEPQTAQLEPERIEVIREVEVVREVPKEIIVEVPKEVIREVLVEVPVEVPVEVLVDRRVPHPMQSRYDAALAVMANVSSAALWGAEGLGSALELASSRQAMQIADAMGDPGTELVAAGNLQRIQTEAPTAARRGEPGARQTGALVVLRDGDRLSLRTRGTREEVVPALIDALDGADRALASAAHGQLLGIRARMVASGTDVGSFPAPRLRTSASLDGPIDEAGGLRGLLRTSRSAERADRDGAPSLHSADEWRAWWRSVSPAR